MPELITIGKIINTQGHKGELKVLPLTDFPERFLTTSEVILNLREQNFTYHIDAARIYKKYIIISIREIPDMNTALNFKSALIQVAKDQLVKLPEGHFYIFDIVGLEVYTIDGMFIGQVSDVITTGSNDVYVVKNSDNNEILLPAIKEVVREINIKEQKMLVNLIEEY